MTTTFSPGSIRRWYVLFAPTVFCGAVVTRMAFQESRALDIKMNEWPKKWQETLDACTRFGGQIVRPLTIANPANSSEVIALEKAIGRTLPVSFRRMLLEFSSGVDFCWNLPYDRVLPDEFREIFGGGISWSLGQVVEAEKERKGWQDGVFPNPDDPYDSVWHDKLGWLNVPNGDVIAFDNKVGEDSPIVYLSHDDGEGHGHVLGENFIDFISRWSLVGCPGPEDWQMMPFISSPTSGIEPGSENAQKWREWFGLQ